MKRISIQGFPGAFHHIAAANYEGSPVEVVGRHTFDEVITDVMNDDTIDYGMMAIENSIAGTLLRNYSLIQNSGVKIVGETYLRIKQNLLALPGTQLKDLKEVHSHPIALAQCEQFFSQYPDVQLVSTYDTAESAYDISQNGNNQIGAIASSLAGEMYHLEMLAESIETNKQNYTRFLVLDDHMPDQQFDKISISFRVSHAIGSLYKALENLSLNKCNLTKIQSVPILGEPWQYLFFADFVLAQPERLDEIIDELSQHARGVRVLGKYKEGQHYEG
ncbi:prephenate dehydratase [Membranicola marinus]|uniref:prephenate dehydratase n=1 Tax=Membranihabitans marinus TaxID=1227546 RepID=A0A953HTU1_9BACT|nr:prephenate dehydratase [Membranihabitans marinus]MBY5958310.1 prephenate dehydratase [Membranihabitans marinus]